MRCSGYEVILADTRETRREHHRLRHFVFCQNKQFEPPDAHPEGLETDEHDHHALHFLLRRREPTAPYFGAVRLLLPNRQKARPIEQLCSLEATSSTEHTGEVSRLILTQEATQHGHLPLYLLCQAAYQAGLEHGLTQLIFLIRNSLIRLLRRRGLALRHYGPPCSHRGLRYPCGNDLVTLQSGLAYWRQQEAYPERLLVPAYQRASTLNETSGRSTHTDTSVSCELCRQTRPGRPSTTDQRHQANPRPILDTPPIRHAQGGVHSD